MLLNCGVREDFWESLELQGDPIIHCKGDQTWVFIGGTDVEAKVPILWPPDVKNWLISKDPDAGKDWGQEEKVATEDDMVGWHHQLNRQESEQIVGDSEGQGSLMCYGPWGLKESDTTEWLNKNNQDDFVEVLPGELSDLMVQGEAA